jgi:hypothetical protein
VTLMGAVVHPTRANALFLELLQVMPERFTRQGALTGSI